MLHRCGTGLGALAFSQLFAEAEAKGAPHFRPRAKRVLHIFLNGGLSQVDSFDPKPMLARYAGKPLPDGASLKTERKTGGALPSPFVFEKHGKSGLPISELFPHLARHADELCVIRSMKTDLPNHEPALLMMNCGDSRLSRPSFGAWSLYGLGTENKNLPGFVVLCPGGYPIQESQNWQAAFLPGAFQGTYIDTAHVEIEKLIGNIRNDVTGRQEQRRQLDALRALDELHGSRRPEDNLLEARIASYELAFQMQVEASDAFDVSGEPEKVRERYGPGVHGRQLLIARRLLERGVRFVQVWHGAGQPWDNHEAIGRDHRKLAGECDRPIGALLTDLKDRGLLEDTLVLCSGEFGRTPVSEGKPGTALGRDHDPYGFSVWLAGGGVKKGLAYGATDDFGFKAVENPVHVHDLHATMLHLMGFDHEKLVHRYAGRDFRLTDVHGRVVRDVIA
jgi:hypothetical protein